MRGLAEVCFLKDDQSQDVVSDFMTRSSKI
jgi:hypothetical protein